MGKGSRKKVHSREEGRRLDREEAMKSSPMTARQLALTMKRSQDRHPDIPYVFLIGAGCSRSSGILLASELVRDVWMPEIQKELELKPDEYPDGFDKENPGAWYSKAVSYLFPTADRQQTEFAQLTMDAQPGFGYYVLSELMDTHKKQFSTVLTTNFDNLLVDALTFFQGAQPLVVYHSQLIRMATPERERPAIIKLHNDIFYSPRNTEEDLDSLDDDLVSKVADLLRHRPLIIMGYSGNDPSVLKLLQACDTEMEIYWVGSRLPEDEGFRRWLTSPNAKAKWVKHGDFDRLMLEVANVFEMKGGPDRNKVLKRLDDVEEHYQKVSSELIVDVKDPATGDIETPPQPSEEAMAYLVYQQALEDPDNGDVLFSDAIRSDPNSSDLHRNYASFLGRRDRLNDAETYHNIALELDPNDALNCGLYALILEKLGRFDDAESQFKHSIELDPKDAFLAMGFAKFLEQQKRSEEAEEFYNQAITADPGYASALINYSLFLEGKDRMVEAEEQYKRCLIVAPDFAYALTNFALFLEKLGRSDESEVHFKRAVQAVPTGAYSFSMYAQFLTKQDRLDEAENAYRNAAELEPEDSFYQKKYADFLEEYDRSNES